VRLIGFNTLVYLVFGLVGFAAAALSIPGDDAPAGMVAGWLVGPPILIAAALWFTSPRRVERWTAPARGVVRSALAIGVGGAWWVRRAVGSREGRPMLGWAGLYWLGAVTGLWASLHAFGADLSLPSLLLAFATGYAASILPLPFVATGGVDAATTFALEAVGVPLEVALVAVVANRVFSFWLPLWPGLLFAALLPATGRKLERAAADRPGAAA
jgi:uncharacterized membrane protein YbhN (UPF0104 family)